MIVRRKGKRGISYGVRIWTPDDSAIGGRRHEWIGTFGTLAEAREAQAKVILERGKRPKGRPVWTVGDFSERWLERYHGPHTKRPEHTTLIHNRDAINHFVKANGHRKLRDVEISEARDYAGEFPWRARVVKALFADAVRDGKLHSSPFDGVSVAAGDGRKRISPLTMAEIDRLGEVAESTLGFYGPHFAAFIRFAGWTGMRPGELCRMEWADVNWATGKLEIPKTKTKQPRTIRLAPPALEILRSIARLDEFVFLTKRRKRMKPYSYRFYWTQVRAAFTAEVPRDHWLSRRLRDKPDDHLDVYECRHATASMLIAQGLLIEEVAAYLGNSPQVCRETYVHLYEDRYEDRLVAAFDRIATEMTGTQSGQNRGAG